MYNLIINSLGLFLSIVALWFFSELAVNYSVKTSVIFGLDKLFFGFAFVAVATGLPELSVAMIGLLKDVPTLSVGTILGSNISDVSMVLGLGILFYGALKLDKSNGKNYLLMLFIATISSAFVFILGFLNYIIGFLLIISYFFTIYFIWRITKNKKLIKKTIDIDNKKKIVVLIKLLISVLFVFISSEFIVKFSLIISDYLNIAKHIIGVTILSIATSLPELTLTLSALRKKEYDIALGNSLGSVLEQGTLLIGIVSISSVKVIDIKPLISLAPFMFLPFFIIFTSIVWRKKIGRLEAVIMLLSFLIFLMYQILI